MKTRLMLNDYQTVNDYIRSHRIALGKSQKYLADKVGIDQMTVMHIENKKTKLPSFPHVLKLLQVLREEGAPPIDLYQLS